MILILIIRSDGHLILKTLVLDHIAVLGCEHGVIIHKITVNVIRSLHLVHLFEVTNVLHQSST